VSYSSPQFLALVGAAVALVLWYKGYLDSFVGQLGFGKASAPAGDDLFLRAVKKAVTDAEAAAHQAAADRFRTQIQEAVTANFNAAGPITPQAPSPPAPPAPAASG
jgi:hypothetical protein